MNSLFGVGMLWGVKKGVDASWSIGGVLFMLFLGFWSIIGAFPVLLLFLVYLNVQGHLKFVELYPEFKEELEAQKKYIIIAMVIMGLFTLNFLLAYFGVYLPIPVPRLNIPILSVVSICYIIYYFIVTKDARKKLKSTKKALKFVEDDVLKAHKRLKKPKKEYGIRGEEYEKLLKEEVIILLDKIENRFMVLIDSVTDEKKLFLREKYTILLNNTLDSDELED